MDPLYMIEIQTASDPLKRDPELVCIRCKEVLCDVEHGDALAVLVAVAHDHKCKVDEK